ncbi:MAG: hypothetical protein PUK62_00875 [Prevotellaceae bacterium]|nr:hypothetical protein [Prevotellaceae bacterium]
MLGRSSHTIKVRSITEEQDQTSLGYTTYAGLASSPSRYSEVIFLGGSTDLFKVRLRKVMAMTIGLPYAY